MELQIDGARTLIADYGKGFDPGRPTALFVHGAGMDHSVWPLQARHFAYRGWNALAVDLPRHGRSAGELRAESALRVLTPARARSASVQSPRRHPSRHPGEGRDPAC